MANTQNLTCQTFEVDAELALDNIGLLNFV
jgi:hypothetical protein